MDKPPAKYGQNGRLMSASLVDWALASGASVMVSVGGVLYMKRLYECPYTGQLRAFLHPVPQYVQTPVALHPDNDAEGDETRD